MCNAIGDVFRLGILAGVGVALAMQFFVTFRCEFLQTPNGNVGIWYVDDGTGACTEWETNEEFATGAQSALTISTAVGFAAGVLVLFEWLFCEVCCAGCLEGFGLVAAWFFGGAVYTIYAIEDCGNGEQAITEGEIPGTNDCKWGPDASLMATACGCYLLCSFVLCCAPQPNPLCRR